MKLYSFKKELKAGELSNFALELSDHFNDPSTSELQFITLYLIDQRQHASFPSGNEDYEKAASELATKIASMGNRFVPLIRMYDNELIDLLQLRKSSTKTTDVLETRDEVNQASLDTSLTKENDTPDGGNIDLTTDNYITRSMRNNLNSGERERNSLGELLREEANVEVDDIRTLLALENMYDLVKDLYNDWLTLIDQECLTFDLDSL